MVISQCSPSHLRSDVELQGCKAVELSQSIEIIQYKLKYGRARKSVFQMEGRISDHETLCDNHIMTCS